MAVQNGFEIVQVSWTAPPRGRYRVIADPGGVSADSSVSPQGIILPQLGVYNITVRPISQHYQVTAAVEVTVRGE